MSDSKLKDACTPNDFGAIWDRRITNVESKSFEKKVGSSKSGKLSQQSDRAATPSCSRKDLQTPKRRAHNTYSLNNADSPGDGELTQDIIWDPTSPPPANPGKGCRRKSVEISDIVNRIAPKDVKPLGVDSPLLQWIGDSAVPCTPPVTQPRVRKKSTRQSKVEDLMKLAKQFDMNMQQNKETVEQLNNINENISACRTEVAPSPRPSVSTSQRMEEELHALFDCSTQPVSGRLSQSSAASGSQEARNPPGASTSTASKPPEMRLADKTSTALSKVLTSTAKVNESPGISMNMCDNFDDDWENDDLLNDSVMLAMDQSSEQPNAAEQKDDLQSNSRLNTNQRPSDSKPASVHSPCHLQSMHPQPRSSELQGLCAKPKTTSRSTFKLETNPHFQANLGATKGASASSFTVINPNTKPQMGENGTALTKSSTDPEPMKTSFNQVNKGDLAPADSVPSISNEDSKPYFDSDSLWDDGNDDDLFYQVCDNVEKIYSSQPEQESLSKMEDKQKTVEDRQQKVTDSSRIEPNSSMSSKNIAKRLSGCGFVRSNSLPGTSSGHVNQQGWNIPMKGANTNHSKTSQNRLDSGVGLGLFGECRNSPGTFQAAYVNPGIQPCVMTAKPTQNSNSRQGSFKRNLSDSAAISNKVFVTGQMTGKCSAAEIEKKKQEALARRRLRMQTSQKP